MKKPDSKFILRDWNSSFNQNGTTIKYLQLINTHFIVFVFFLVKIVDQNELGGS